MPRLLVIREVAFVPHDHALAFKRKNVRGDTVEEPAVMAHHHHAARKIEDRLFERLQGLDVEIVGRFVEQQHVAAALKELGKVHAVALAARNFAHQALLVGTRKVELAHIRAGIHGGLAEHDRIGPAGDLLENRFCLVKRVARLVDIAELDGFAYDQRTRRRPSQPR